MTRCFLSLCLLLSATAAQAYCTGTDLRTNLSEAERAQMAQAISQTPFATGNHWIAQKEDQTIHVIGTMHLDDPRWGPVMEQLGPVVREVDLLFVEMTDTDQADMQ